LQLLDEPTSQQGSNKGKITAEDSTFKNGYSLKLSTHLNQFMVNYDIIRILKTKMGSNCWTDLTEVEYGFCLKNYTPKKGLPDWNTEEENFND
jgi:hypothetical protein